MSDLSIIFNGTKYSVNVMEKYTSWGKGVRFDIFKPNGEHLNTISYICHPEYADYEMYQAMSLEALTKIAMVRLKRDLGKNNLQQASENRVELFLPINKAQY
jgi:hypothetical protein